MACRQFGAKPLSKPILVYCWLHHQEQISMKSQNSNIFIQENAIRSVAATLPTFCLYLNDLTIDIPRYNCRRHFRKWFLITENEFKIINRNENFVNIMFNFVIRNVPVDDQAPLYIVMNHLFPVCVRVRDPHINSLNAFEYYLEIIQRDFWYFSQDVTDVLKRSSIWTHL